MELTIEKAYELAVKKWEYIVKHNGYDIDEFPYRLRKLNTLLHGCSYCELYYCKGGFGNCKGCPLRPKRFRDKSECGCNQPGHPFAKWANTENKENAQAVLDLIIKTKPCTDTN